MAGLDSNERDIVSKILESKAVDFEALGTVIGQIGPEMIFRLEGDEGFCGTMRNFIRLYRLGDTVGELDQLERLQEVTAELQGALAR